MIGWILYVMQILGMVWVMMFIYFLWKKEKRRKGMEKTMDDMDRLAKDLESDMKGEPGEQMELTAMVRMLENRLSARVKTFEGVLYAMRDMIGGFKVTGYDGECAGFNRELKEDLIGRLTESIEVNKKFIDYPKGDGKEEV